MWQCPVFMTFVVVVRQGTDQVFGRCDVMVIAIAKRSKVDR